MKGFIYVVVFASISILIYFLGYPLLSILIAIIFLTDATIQGFSHVWSRLDKIIGKSPSNVQDDYKIYKEGLPKTA